MLFWHFWTIGPILKWLLFWPSSQMDLIPLKYCHINKKREKSNLSASIHVIFSWTFRYAGRKSCSIFVKFFNLVFLLCFSVIRWNFGIFFGSFQRVSITVGRMDINWPSLVIICNGWLNHSMSFQVSNHAEQKWKRYTWIVCHLYAKWCTPVKQIKVYLNVQRLGYA